MGHEIQFQVPSIPQHLELDVHERLVAARSKAVEAVLIAEDAESKARALRRAATAQLKAYERLLAEHDGQLRLEGVDDEGALRR